VSLPRPASDHTAVITGGSSGIGKAIAHELARRGHNVALVARSIDRLEAVAAEITGSGVRADVLPADLSDRRARAQLVTRIRELGLVPDILVNCAGLSTMGRAAAADPEAEIEMLEVDVVAVVDLCSRFLPGLVARGQGAVLNVASTGAFQPLPGQAGYGAAKAFVVSYTQSLSGELRGTGVTASVLCPGPVDTGFGEKAGFSKEDAEAALPRVMWKSPETVARAGVEAIEKGRVVTIPGSANRAAAFVSRLVPNRVLIPLVAKNHPALRG
jgi:short-subunit dehydrogenase